MEELAVLLREYKLASPRGLSRILRIMGRRTLQNLLEDLSSFGSERRGTLQRRRGDLRVAPIGGDLGLGTATDVIREVMLYADHVVFVNDLSLQAQRLCTHLPEAKDFDSQKDQIIHVLHPLLYQFWLLEPIWARGLASFAYCDPGEHVQNHPLVPVVKPAAIGNVQYFDGSPPWMEMRVGSRVYAANPTMRTMEPTVMRMGSAPATSTRGMNLLQEGFFTYYSKGQALEPGPADVLLEEAHELTDAFNEFLSFEIERMENHSQLVMDAEASFITDSPDEWGILGTLASHDPVGNEIPTAEAPSLTFDIARELAFLEGISLESLLELREEMPDEHARFRAALLALARDRSGDPQKWKEEALRIVKEELEPALGALAFRVRQSADGYVNAGAGVLLAAGLCGMIAFISQSALPLAAAIPMLQTVLSAAQRYEQAQDDEMYFLLTVSQEADGE